MTLSVIDMTSGGMPKVEVLLEDLDSDVRFVTMYRLSKGSEEEVRGIINTPISGGGSWIDFEVPAAPATYRAEFFDSGGQSLGFSESVTVELGFTETWMHNPLAPSGGVAVTLADTTARSLSRPVPGEIVYPRGRRVGIMVSAPRRGITGGVFDVICSDLETADKIQAFLGGDGSIMTPVVCIRIGTADSAIRVRSPLFLGVLDIAEEDWDLRDGGTTTVQRIQGDEVSAPAPGIFVPLLRRMDIDAYYATRQAIDDDNLSRLSVDRRYELAGTAG